MGKLKERNDPVLSRKENRKQAVCVQCNLVACSRDNCCHKNATMCSLCIVAYALVVFNNIKALNFATEMQQWVPFALLSRYKIFRTAVNNKNVLRPSLKMPDICLTILNKIELSRQIS